MTRGRLVILTGPNGAGKDTQGNLLERRWEKEHGLVAKYIYAPRINFPSRGLQDTILSQGSKLTDPFAEFLAYITIHFEVAHTIAPLLDGGLNIVLVRGPETALVYNAVANQLQENELELAHRLYGHAMSILRPDMVIVLSVTLEESRHRAALQAKSDHIQERSDPYFERLLAAYTDEAKRYGWRVINAKSDEDTVHRLVWAAVEPLTKEKSWLVK